MMNVRTFLIEFFTWWNGQTMGLRYTLARRGERVGEDAAGNVYYRSRGGAIDPALGRERRWVVYPGLAEASTIPPGWHGWMHHKTDTPPTEDGYRPRDWEEPHRPNMTGTPQAYRPQGSTLATGERPAATGDYAPWRP